MRKPITIATLAVVMVALLIKPPTRTIMDAASHREAPLISQDPLADNTDVYAFVSPDRPDTVTILANYIPFEEPSGGPGYFRFDPHVLYEIKIDNTGDGEEDIVYQFRFKNTIANPDTFLIHRGPGVLGVDSDAQISSLNDPDYNLKQTYSVVRKVRKSRHAFESTVLGTDLVSPPPNIGTGATRIMLIWLWPRFIRSVMALRCLPDSATRLFISTWARSSTALSYAHWVSTLALVRREILPKATTYIPSPCRPPKISSPRMVRA